MHTAEATAWVSAPPAVVAEMFWDMATWRQVWDLIERVEVTYQDPHQQEFVMDVERDGAVERVRTIRYRRPNGIELFSPQPPPMMTVHRGWWRFQERSGGTEVTAQRRYLLAAGHPDGDGFRARFSSRLQAILDQFATAAERSSR